MTASALVVPVSAAEPVVGRWRADLDPSAGAGMPAHLTVLFPWLPADALDAPTLAALADLVSSVPAFDVSFGSFDRFTHTLWLAPTPSDPINALTTAVATRWPERPPYEGRFAVPTPHLTVGDTVDPDALAHVVADVSPQLPVQARIDRVSLMVRDGDGPWTEHSSYPLGEAD